MRMTVFSEAMTGLVWPGKGNGPEASANSAINLAEIKKGDRWLVMKMVERKG